MAAVFRENPREFRRPERDELVSGKYALVTPGSCPYPGKRMVIAQRARGAIQRPARRRLGTAETLGSRHRNGREPVAGFIPGAALVNRSQGAVHELNRPEVTNSKGFVTSGFSLSGVAVQ